MDAGDAAARVADVLWPRDVRVPHGACAERGVRCRGGGEGVGGGMQAAAGPGILCGGEVSVGAARP